jgi:hypothetical protein
MGEGSGLVDGREDTGDSWPKSPALRGRLVTMSLVSRLTRGRFDVSVGVIGADMADNAYFVGEFVV